MNLLVMLEHALTTTESVMLKNLRRNLSKSARPEAWIDLGLQGQEACLARALSHRRQKFPSLTYLLFAIMCIEIPFD